jgi:ElaB/YqjD/DUF883 family membrane-anchored ribosome-binding protein
MNEPNSRDYARDAEAARTRLSAKLTELQDGLTPGRLLDEVLSYGRNGGTFFLKALNNAARENPVPTMLVGAGCAMFLTEKTGLLRHATNGKDEQNGAKGKGDERNAAKDKGATLAKGLKEGAHDAVAALEDGAAKVGDAAAEAAGAVKRRVAGAAEEIGDQVSEASDRVKDQAGKTAHQLKERADAFMQEQPLLAAAIGVAIGALVAAAFPATELEDEMMGETSDAVKETLGEVGSEQLEAARSIASSVADEARHAAAREGLTPAAAADAARDLGDRVSRVVSDTAEAATKQVEERARTDS